MQLSTSKPTAIYGAVYHVAYVVTGEATIPILPLRTRFDAASVIVVE